MVDVDTFRAAVPASMATRVSAKEKKGGRVTGRQTAPFLSGPVPVAWLAAANVAGGSALALGIALWFHRGLRKKYGPILRVNAAVRKAMALTPDQARRAIAALASKGLIHIHTGGRGRCTEVEILDPPRATPSVDLRKPRDDARRGRAGQAPWHVTYDRPPATQRDADTAAIEGGGHE
jgi:hypothetical protein